MADDNGPIPASEVSSTLKAQLDRVAIEANGGGLVVADIGPGYVNE